MANGMKSRRSEAAAVECVRDTSNTLSTVCVRSRELISGHPHARATLTYFNSWDRLRIFFFARSVGVINIGVLILFILGATV